MERVKEIFVINLKRRPDRLQEFKQRYPLTQPFTLIEAVDGNNLPYDKPPLSTLSKSGQINPFALGCTLSHYEVWKRVVENTEYKDEDVFITFEDDVFFVQDFENKFIQCLQPNITFDMLTIGGRFRPNFVPHPNSLQILWDRITENVFQYKSKDHQDGPNQDRTTHSLVWTKKFAKDFLKYLDEHLIETAVDKLLTKFWKENNTLLLEHFPHLCFSPPNYKTDIQQKRGIKIEPIKN